MFPHLRVARRARRARGGAAARLRRHHPGPRAAVPHATRGAACCSARRSTTRRAGSSTRSRPSSSSTSTARAGAAGPSVDARHDRSDRRRASRRLGTAHGEPARDRIVDAGDPRRAATGAHAAPSALGLRVGDDVRHAKFGEGVILDIEGEGDKAEAIVRFPGVGEKRLLLVVGPLEKARRRDPMAAAARGRAGSPRATTRSARSSSGWPTVHGDRALVEEADGGLRLTVRAGGQAGRPVGGRRSRARSPRRPGRRHLERLRAVAAVPGRVARRRACRCRSTRRCARTRSTTSSSDSGAALVVRDAVELDGAPGSSTGARRRARRRRRALLHVGHDRQAEGRRAHPSRRCVGQVDRRRRSARASCAATRRCVALPVAHIMGFAALLGLACAGIPVYFLPRFRPIDVLDAIEQRRATMFVGVPAMYRMCSRPAPTERDLTSRAGVGLGRRRDARRPRAPFKRMGATRDAARRRARRRGALRRGLRHGRVGGGVALKARRRCSTSARRVARHPAARLPVPGRRRRRPRGRASARSASCWVQGPRRPRGLLRRRGGHRRRADRRRLAAHRRPRPRGRARHAVLLRRPQEGRDQARRLLGLRGRGRGGARGASRRARGRGRRARPTRARARSRSPQCASRDGANVEPADLVAWAAEHLVRLQGRRGRSSSSTSCPAPAPQGPEERAGRPLRRSRLRRGVHPAVVVVRPTGHEDGRRRRRRRRALSGQPARREVDHERRRR